MYIRSFLFLRKMFIRSFLFLRKERRLTSPKRGGKVNLTKERRKG